MPQDCSARDAERLQRAVLCLAFELHPQHLPRKLINEKIGTTLEVASAIQVLVRARLLRWEDEALSLTVPALVFDRLAL
jgi:hypothetical protein